MVRPPLPQAEFDEIFSRVPRLTVELVIAEPERGVLLTLRESGPCAGLWHLPGGTVRFGEVVTDAVARVARDELGLSVVADELLGYLEYPSHFEHGLDTPVGMVFRARPQRPLADPPDVTAQAGWFREPPAAIHDEQRAFLNALTLGP